MTSESRPPEFEKALPAPPGTEADPPASENPQPASKPVDGRQVPGAEEPVDGQDAAAAVPAVAVPIPLAQQDPVAARPAVAVVSDAAADPAPPEPVPADAYIRLEGVSKSFDTVKAVQRLSLGIGKGDTLGLIGPNGSGKTTLLRMVCSLSKPDCGSIHIGDCDVVRHPRAMRSRLAFMPAEFGMPNEMTIREYLSYFACLLDVAPDYRDQTVDEVLELTDLKPREEVGIRGLSTGNRQRVLLAKTLLGDPEILILDEPASGLDPRARAEVRLILRELARMQKTVLISSHILADIEEICTHICILEAGHKRLSGSIGDLRRQFRKAERLVWLQVPEADRERALQVLGALPDVLTCQFEENRLNVSSKESNCNYLLRALIEADIEVLEMREEQAALEDIFIASTQGEVT